MTATVKLIRVTDGLYRTEGGGVFISKQGWSRDTKDRPWVVRFTNGYGCRVEKRFSSIKAVRHYLNTGEAE